MLFPRHQAAAAHSVQLVVGVAVADEVAVGGMVVGGMAVGRMVVGGMVRSVMECKGIKFPTGIGAP